MNIDVNQTHLIFTLSCMIWYTWEATTLETGEGLATPVVHKLKNLSVAWGVNSWSQVQLVYCSYSKLVVKGCPESVSMTQVFHVSKKQAYPSHVGSLNSREVSSSWLTLGVVSARSVSYIDSGSCAYLFDYRIVSCVRKKPNWFELVCVQLEGVVQLTVWFYCWVWIWEPDKPI